jgi:hypothetical protein
MCRQRWTVTLMRPVVPYTTRYLKHGVHVMMCGGVKVNIHAFTTSATERGGRDISIPA